jgi:zinc transport system ATP-binding protein
LLQPKSGSITVMGETPEKGRRRIGYVPQFAEYDAEFPISVRDVVRMGRLSSQRLFKPYSTEDDRVVDERLDWVGMLEYQDRAIRELSGGQRQRVYIARALTTNPTLLVLDEPTISVDIEARTQIYELLHKINQDGVTIFLVTHDLNVISSYVKTIGCLNRKLHYHGEKQITDEMLQSTYGCPVDLIAHGLPHRVLAEHKGGN